MKRRHAMYFQRLRMNEILCCHVHNSNNTSSTALWKKELAFTLSSQNKSRREELLTVDTHFLCICNTNYVDFITALPNHANWSWWRTPWKKNQRTTFSKAGKSLRRTPRALQTSWNKDFGPVNGFHSDVITLQSQQRYVLRILIYTRLKINRK